MLMDLSHPSGADNEQIGADLAHEHADTMKPRDALTPVAATL